MDDYYFITLHCYDCDNAQCSICPCGTYVAEDNLRGCTRKVSEDDYARYDHYINEVLPFLHLDKNKESISRTYNEVLEFLYYIYSQPLGQKLGKSGRAILS